MAPFINFQTKNDDKSYIMSHVVTLCLTLILLFSILDGASQYADDEWESKKSNCDKVADILAWNVKTLPALSFRPGGTNFYLIPFFFFIISSRFL